MPASQEHFPMASCRDFPDSGAATLPDFTADMSGIHTRARGGTGSPIYSFLTDDPRHTVVVLFSQFETKANI
jgi:hypothetical protein